MNKLLPGALLLLWLGPLGIGIIDLLCLFFFGHTLANINWGSETGPSWRFVFMLVWTGLWSIVYFIIE